MSTTSRTVEYKDGDLEVKLTIVKSTVRIGMMRTLMMERARVSTEGNEGSADNASYEADAFISMFLYPSLICAVSEQQGFDHWPITLEEFLELPEPMEYEWEKAVFEINPHWRPVVPQTEAEIEEAQKKVTGTT